MTDSELTFVKQAIGEAITPLADELKKTNKIIFGNGEPQKGLCFRICAIEEFIERLKTAPKISWILLSQFITWGVLVYSIIKR